MATSTVNTPLVSVNSRQNPPNPSSSYLPPNGNIDLYLANQKLLSLTEKCSNLTQIKQVHTQMIKTGLIHDPFTASKLLSALTIQPVSDLGYAQKLFDDKPQPNLYSWNTIIRGYADDDPFKGLLVFLRMIHECPELPNKFTFPVVIKLAPSAGNGGCFGKGVHGMAVKLGYGLDMYVVNSLIGFYAACGYLSTAEKVFFGIPEKDVVSWNAMIKGYVVGGCPEKAVELYEAMLKEGFQPDEKTMVGVLSACSEMGDLELGRLMHLRIDKHGIDSSLALDNAVLDMYAKCGSIEEAEMLFDRMEEKDEVSWTTMIVGYAKLGKFSEARRALDTMSHWGISAWNALMAAYEQNGMAKEALGLFHDMLASGKSEPNDVSFACALKACGQLGAAEIGSLIHVYLEEQGIELQPLLCSSLISMYSKCGDLDRAVQVFESSEGTKHVFVWSAMIAGLAMHGRGRAAIDIFSQMEEAGIKPDADTFINVLTACRYSGLLEEGKYLFEQMQTTYGVEPQPEHYSCMIDILARAGLLEEAKDLMKQMSENYC